MKKYKIDVIDINSVLPLYILTNDGDSLKQTDRVDIPDNEVIFEQIEIEIIDNNNDIDEYIPDEGLGKLGEDYIEKRLLSQKEKSSNQFEVERVSETRRNKSPGYDIEVIKEDLIIGVEVKAKRGNENNIIHITNNEIKAMIRLKYNNYLVIVVFDKETDEVRELFRIKNPIETFKIDIFELEKIISTYVISNIDFYPQVYLIKFPKDILKTCKISLTDNIV
jgi:hypothetical protein